MSVFIHLAVEFFKTGLFAIGGGLATLPFLYEIANKYSWLDASLMSDMIAVSESTPGPIGVNMATYAGYNAGLSLSSPLFAVLGSVVATLFLVLPSVIVIIIVANFLERFKNSRIVDDAFSGLRPAVCGLIASACLNIFSSACLNASSVFDWSNIADSINVKAIILFAVFFILTRKTKFHPIFYIIPAGIVGILFKM